MDARHCASNVLRVERAGGRTGDEVSEERSKGGWRKFRPDANCPLGGSGSSRAGERDASRNAARGSGDPRRALARGYSHVRHVSASRAAGSTRDALASRDRRDAGLLAIIERGGKPAPAKKSGGELDFSGIKEFKVDAQ